MNSKTTKLGLYIIISFLIFIFGVFFSELTENLQPLIISFCFFYVITVLCTIKEFGLVSLYSVYIYTSAFFMYDCLLLTLIYPDKNFLEQSFPIRYVFSENVGKIFIDNQGINFGESLGKNIGNIGNIGIKVVVGVDYNDAILNFKTLQNTNMSEIIKLSKKTFEGISILMNK